MSFYDLTKDNVLRPGELFKYRQKRDCTIPSRGGQKDFEPDASWMQCKQLETFLQEKTSILSEPRVEKLKNVVEGVWDEEKRLVNLKKQRKFWMHMGFTDERRNWLYPEEALFLMETNILELYCNERPISIQEAYSKLLGQGMCLEEYQVFAHLRRLGYVVLRHEEERLFTDYERKINLNEYIDKRERKEKLMKGKGKSTKKISQSVDGKLPKTDSMNKGNDANMETCDNEISGDGEGWQFLKETLTRAIDNPSGDFVSSKRNLEDLEVEDGKRKKRKLVDGNEGKGCSTESELHTPGCSEENNESSSFYNISSWLPCFTNDEAISSEREKGKLENDSDCIQQDTTFVNSMPDLAQRSEMDLNSPPSHLLPSNLDVSELEFNTFMANLKKPGFIQFTRASDNLGPKHVTEKCFSCLVETNQEAKVKAKSWADYKRKKKARNTEMATSTQVDFLWKDTVTPLMHPASVTNYADVLDKLKIIQAVDSHELVPDDSALSAPPKVSFDVHLPDHHFKKSMPGLPDHRVCVARCDGVPPGLAAIQYYTNNNKDNVPLHWAVVDSGEIAFYVFDNSKPLDLLSPN